MMTITYTHRNGLYINLTNRCPNSCDFCVRSYGDTLYGNLWLEREPTVDEVIRSIEQYNLNEFKEVVFCGYGGPTERLDEMLTICRYIRERVKLPIRLNTNGQMELIWGEEATPKMKGLFDIVSISLNAADADTYDAVCHSRYGKSAYDAILKFAEHVKPYVGKVVLSVVDTTISPEEIQKCREMAESIGVELRVREFI